MPIPTEIVLKSAGAPQGERFNYTGMHRYILTLPAHGPGATFTGSEIVTAVLNTLREAGWHHHFDIYAYCFLQDRLLLIIRGREETSQMKEFLREFRSTSEAALAPQLGHPLWKKKYLERVLRKTEITSDAAEALFLAPVKLGLATSPREYPFQGSFVRNPLSLFGPPERPSKPAPFSRTGAGQGGPRRPGPRTGPPGKGGGTFRHGTGGGKFRSGQGGGKSRSGTGGGKFRSGSGGGKFRSGTGGGKFRSDKPKGRARQ